jgi:hypothetical protein
MNFEKLFGRGRRPAAGDVFTARLAGHKLMGLVVGADLHGVEAPMGGDNLVYVYDPERWPDAIPTDQVEPDDLLIPPSFTNQRPWTIGYFQKVGSVALTDKHRLRQHCFRVEEDYYVDERSNRLPHKIEPCGDWVLGSTEWIDDQASDALGIPRAT